MLIDIKNKLRRSNRKNPELKITPGENIRDALIKTGIKTAEESAYVAGNTTEKVINLAEKLGDAADRGSELVLGGESATALGNIAFKTTKDIARGDMVCTGLCAISGTCETIALVCSTVKVIPYRGRIYVGAKVVSRGCMTYRNLCASEGC